MYSFTKKILIILVIVFFVLLLVTILTLYVFRPTPSPTANQMLPTPIPSSGPVTTVEPITTTEAELRITERSDPNGNLVAEIALDSAARISAVDLQLSYPSQELVYIETQDGNYFTESLDISNEADPDAGIVYVSVGSLTPESGEAVLARVIFDSFVTQPGQSSLVKIFDAVASSPDYDKVNLIY